jgi:hypothetical protein
MLTDADVCSHIYELDREWAHAYVSDVFYRMLTYADVC